MDSILPDMSVTDKHSHIYQKQIKYTGFIVHSIWKIGWKWCNELWRMSYIRNKYKMSLNSKDILTIFDNPDSKCKIESTIKCVIS